MKVLTGAALPSCLRLARLILCAAVLAGGHAMAARQPRDVQAERALTDALFTNNALLRLRIEIPPDKAAELRKDRREYVCGTLKEGDVVYEDVGFRLKGSVGSFRNVDQKPGWTLNFNTFEASSRFHGLKKFHLNNCAQDRTFLSEWLCTPLFRQAGVPASRVAHALVEFNGRDLGLYVLMEANDEDFLARYFKNNHGNVYGQSRGGDITFPLERMEGKGPLDWADLRALVAAVQEPDAARRWQRMQEKLDVNRFVSFLAMEVMLCHIDGYTINRHNYRVCQDLDTGKMVFVPHDMDRMMMNANMPILPQANGVVAQAILNTPETRRLYRQRFGQLFTNVFDTHALTNRLTQYVSHLLPALAEYNSNFAMEFESYASSLKSRVLARGEAVKMQLQRFEPKRLIFRDGLARLGPWEPQKEQPMVVTRTGSLENKAVLYVQSPRQNGVGSWRCNVLLPAGKYYFSGKAKTTGLMTGKRGANMGGSLYAWGHARADRLTGNSDWTQMECGFELAREEEVMLVCELRSQGEIWFDTESLVLEKVK